jgi:hypothetical protein
MEGSFWTEYYISGQLQFLSYFYTDYVGLKVVHTGVISVTKIWDACNVPIMGAIIDSVILRKENISWLRVVTYILPLTMCFCFIDVVWVWRKARICLCFFYFMGYGLYHVGRSYFFSFQVMSKSSYEGICFFLMGGLQPLLAAMHSNFYEYKSKCRLDGHGRESTH